jgi:hypothetical protein
MLLSISTDAGSAIVLLCPEKNLNHQGSGGSTEAAATFKQDKPRPP